MYSYLIGTLLNVLYAPDLIRINPNTRNVLYNVKIHSNPVKEIIIKDLEEGTTWKLNLNLIRNPSIRVKAYTTLTDT